MTELQKSLMLNIAIKALTDLRALGWEGYSNHDKNLTQVANIADDAILDMNAIQEATFPAIVAMEDRLDEEALEAERKGTPHAA